MNSLSQTRNAFIWSHVLTAPLFAMFTLFVFIFYKDLHATPLQITLLFSAKPVVSIFSFYWNAYVNQRRNRLKKGIVLATLVGLAPCFFFPIAQSNWFFVLAYALYMMASKAIIPAWMELLKIGVQKDIRSKVFSLGSSANYVTSLIVPFIVSYWMDSYVGIWRYIFCFAAILGLFSLFLLLIIPKPLEAEDEAKKEISFSIASPWKKFVELMQNRPDFAHFQIIFMLGGLGLMIMLPSLPVFTEEILKLSYTELVVAISICKSVGYTLTTRMWANAFNNISIYLLTFYTTFLAALFPLILMMASIHFLWVYAAYLVYGIMQAGSEMCWNLSGPRFSGKENSSDFTNVNVMLVGLRGCIGPSLGGYLGIASPYVPLVAGSFVCLSGAFYALYNAKVINREISDVA